MSIKYVKWHKQRELEKIAGDIHKAYQCEIPIDIDYVTEMMEIDIVDINRLKEDFGLYGCLAKIKDKFTIFVQKGDFKVTNYHTNFTIAEELAHFILHKVYFKNVNNFHEAFEFYNKINSDSEMMIELNAKYLAGAILMPRDDFKNKAAEIYYKHETVFTDLLKDLDDEKYELITSAIASRLSDLYRVPEGAAAFRLKTKAIGFKQFLERRINKVW